MNILFFDIETTGTPKNYKAPVTDLTNWPRVIQLAWEITEYDTGKIINKASSLVKPDGWTVPKERFWEEHGYATEINEKFGNPMTLMLDAFTSDLLSFDIKVIIAHNIDFDYKVLWSEMFRYGIGCDQVQFKRFCTMKHGTDVCKIPSPYGYKWPKLEELHRYLFNIDIENSHDASTDVSTCRKCFFEMKQRGLISI